MHTKNDQDSVENDEEQPLKNENINIVQYRNFWKRLKHIMSNITVEPVMMFFVTPGILSVLGTQNLNLDKACRVNLEFGDAVCTDLSLRKRDNHTYEENEVQKLVASVNAWGSIILTVVPTILMLFIGAWSDKTGRRKICMAMPIFGEFITCILNMINTYFFYEVSVEWTVLMEVLLPAFTGGWNTLMLGVYSYLSDITTKETRTYRLGILSLCMTASYPIGMGLSGVLLKYIGYYGVFSVTATLFVMNLCYVIFGLKDHTWLDTKEKKKKSVCTGFFSEFFDFRSLKDTVHIVFKKGANNRRLRICLIMTMVCLCYGPFIGELSIMYIFSRYRFNWDEVKYSIFSMYSFIVHALGTMFSISIFSKRLGLDDALLGVIATISKIAGSFLLIFARNDIEIYLVPLVQILDGTAFIALRAIASKLVPPQELGKVFSLFGLAETMMPLIYVPMYSRVYILTLHILPGATFLITLASFIPATGIFIWFYSRHKKDARERRSIPTATDAIINA